MRSIELPQPANHTKPSQPEGKMKVRRTYKYRLYASKRDKQLHQQIDVAGIIWNHALAIQKRYDRLTGKTSSQFISPG